MTRAKDKARWGFGGDKKCITIGTEQATGAQDIMSDSDDEFDGMTKKQLLEFAAEHEIEVDKGLKVEDIRKALRAEFE